jgi:hypothetical protein
MKIGEIFAGMVMTQNISDRKQAEKDIQRSKCLIEGRNKKLPSTEFWWLTKKERRR